MIVSYNCLHKHELTCKLTTCWARELHSFHPDNCADQWSGRPIWPNENNFGHVDVFCIHKTVEWSTIYLQLSGQCQEAATASVIVISYSNCGRGGENRKTANLWVEQSTPLLLCTAQVPYGYCTMQLWAAGIQVMNSCFQMRYLMKLYFWLRTERNKTPIVHILQLKHLSFLVC